MHMMNLGLFGKTSTCLDLGEESSEYVLWFYDGQKPSAETLIRFTCAKVAACSDLLKEFLAHPSISQVGAEQFNELTKNNTLIEQCFCEYTPPSSHAIKLGVSNTINLFKYECTLDSNPTFRNIIDTTISSESCLQENDDITGVLIVAAVALLVAGILIYSGCRKIANSSRQSSSDASIDMRDYNQLDNDDTKDPTHTAARNTP